MTVTSILLLLYSLSYFNFFTNKSCKECGAKFSLEKKGTHKVGECKIEGVSHDINETEYKCNELFLEYSRVPHK